MHQTQWSAERPLPPPVSLTSQSHHEKPAEVTCTSQGKPGFLPQPEKDLERPSSTRLEARFPYHDSRAMTRSPSHSYGDPTSLAPHERLTDLAVVPREKPHTVAAARASSSSDCSLGVVMFPGSMVEWQYENC